MPGPVLGAVGAVSGAIGGIKKIAGAIGGGGTKAHSQAPIGELTPMLTRQLKALAPQLSSGLQSIAAGQQTGMQQDAWGALMRAFQYPQQGFNQAQTSLQGILDGGATNSLMAALQRQFQTNLSEGNKQILQGTPGGRFSSAIFQNQAAFNRKATADQGALLGQVGMQGIQQQIGAGGVLAQMLGQRGLLMNQGAGALAGFAQAERNRQAQTMLPLYQLFAQAGGAGASPLIEQTPGLLDVAKEGLGGYLVGKNAGLWGGGGGNNGFMPHRGGAANPTPMPSPYPADTSTRPNAGIPLP